MNASREGIYLGAGVLLFAAIAGWQTSLIPGEAAYAQIGPAVVPWIVTLLIGGLGASMIAQSLRGRWPAAAPPGAFDAAGLGWLALGLALNLALIGGIGFVLASTVLFACAARAFGSRRPARDAAIGFAIAFIAYLGFDRLLGYRIGGGFIENLI